MGEGGRIGLAVKRAGEEKGKFVKKGGAKSRHLGRS